MRTVTDFPDRNPAPATEQQRQSIDPEPTVDVAIAWSERDRFLGFRVPHCLDGRRPDYELVPAAEQGVAS